MSVCLSALASLAQTDITPYTPGLTEEGAIYFLPKTAVRITVQIEQTTYTPGEFCKYADRYLRLKDVSTMPSTSYCITAIRQEASSVADNSKAYSVRFDPKTVAANVALSDEGVLLAVNATPKPLALQPAFEPAPRPEAIDPRQYMNAEILAAGSTAKMAELTALDIYEIRESRNLLVRGQADNMPQDGAQLRLMLNQLEKQDKVLTSLFAGTIRKDTTEHVVTIVPEQEIGRELVFRFSKKLGIVDNDDLAGEPYYIKVANLHTVPMPDMEAVKKKKEEHGIFINVPGKMKSTVFSSFGDIVTNEFPCAQFGNTELLSGALFNKRYTTHLWINPVTGGVDRLEAEQPK